MEFTYKPVSGLIFAWKEMPINTPWVNIKYGVWMHTEHGEHLELLAIRRESRVRWALTVGGDMNGAPYRIKDLDSGCGCGLHLPDLLERFE